MNILVTAGHTRAMIDQVRTLENIFHGRTGCTLASQLALAGHKVVLLASDPKQLPGNACDKNIEVCPFRSFDDLEGTMREMITYRKFDVIIHSSAVADYKPTGRTFVYNPEETGEDGLPKLKLLPARGKIPSGYTRLLPELEPTIKLVDLIREPLGFKGILVKFKLQVDAQDGQPMTDEELIKIATNSREHSDADVIVANCLAWADTHAIVIGRDNVPNKILRSQLFGTLARMFQ